MVIRRAVASDLGGVERSYQEHFAYEREHGALTIYREGVYPTGKDMEAALRSGMLYIAEENNVVLGSVILDHEQPEEFQMLEWPSGAPEKRVRVIRLLLVRPGSTGKGIGSALVEHVLNVSRRQFCMAVRLDTGAQNTPAISLYEKLGFYLVASLPMKVGGVIYHNQQLFYEKTL